MIHFLTKSGIFKVLVLCGMIFSSCAQKSEPVSNTHPPNIILVMADDLGWGDVAYNGNPIAKTPHLDQMATEGVRLDRFYAASPVCSPTRASCLTGRHPYRVNIPWAGDGFLHPDETTLAEALRTKGYATGHFGKWHVGGMSKTMKQSYFPGPPTTYSPPWENGFGVSFSTESMMPTFNPYYHVGGAYGEEDYRHIQSEPVANGQRTNGAKWRDYYWTGEGQMVDGRLAGDDAELVMNEALKFIKSQVREQQPFLSMVWFHNVHTPVVAGEKHRTMYAGLPMEQQHWYGAISAMDEQIGRLRSELKRMGASDNTIVWFCSDNGPSYIHNYNSAGPFKGKKAELYEGGICVPSVVEWPSRLAKPKVVNTPIVTSDFYPTLLSICGVESKNENHIDGENVWPILNGQNAQRQKPIGFRSPLPNRLKKQEVQQEEQFAFVDNRYKLLSMDNGDTFQLYDITEDPAETHDLSLEFPEVKAQLLKAFDEWSASLPGLVK